jgi:hypothetical protein
MQHQNLEKMEKSKTTADTYEKLLLIHEENAQIAQQKYRYEVNLSNKQFQCLLKLLIRSRIGFTTREREHRGLTEGDSRFYKKCCAIAFHFLRQRFHMVVSIDFQMDKLIPHIGYSSQIKMVYFMKKLSVQICGIIFHIGQYSQFGSAGKFVYISDKLQVGAKDANLLWNYIFEYVQ